MNDGNQRLLIHQIDNSKLILPEDQMDQLQPKTFHVRPKKKVQKNPSKGDAGSKNTEKRRRSAMNKDIELHSKLLLQRQQDKQQSQ